MGRMARSCIQSLLRAVNYGIGMFGVAMILYALWMLRVWLGNRESDHATTPWFTNTVLGLGVLMCLITCSGHVAAETANSCCLYIGMSILLAIILKTLRPHPVTMNYESDDDYLPDRAPLLKTYVPDQSYAVSDQFGPKNKFSEYENQQ